jgi:uncharacterized membrane protein HdeD (DUF308 family)
MLRILTKSWWVLVLRGVMAILLGVLALANPGITAATLVLWIAIFLTVDGALALVTTIARWKEREDKWLHVAEGVLSIVLGFLILRAPEITLFLVILYAAVWSIMSGVARIAMAIQLRKEIEGEIWLAISGLASVVFGILVLAQPGIGLATILWMLGLFLILAGVVLIALGLKVRRLAGKVDDLLEDAAGRVAQRAGSEKR